MANNHGNLAESFEQLGGKNTTLTPYPLDGQMLNIDRKVILGNAAMLHIVTKYSIKCTETYDYGTFEP